MYRDFNIFFGTPIRAPYLVGERVCLDVKRSFEYEFRISLLLTKGVFICAWTWLIVRRGSLTSNLNQGLGYKRDVSDEMGSAKKTSGKEGGLRECLLVLFRLQPR